MNNRLRAHMNNRLRAQVQPFLQSGEEIRGIFPAIDGPKRHWSIRGWMPNTPQEIAMGKHEYLMIAVTDRNIAVFKYSLAHRGAPTELLARLPLQPLAFSKGWSGWDRVIIGGNRYFVKRRFYNYKDDATAIGAAA